MKTGQHSNPRMKKILPTFIFIICVQLLGKSASLHNAAARKEKTIEKLSHLRKHKKYLNKIRTLGE